MPKSSSILFATSNKHKFAEAREILSEFGIVLEALSCEIEEVQSDSLVEISKKKAALAFGMCSRPVLVEDAALSIDALGGFPGPYSSYVFSTIGNKGILKLVGGSRSASFASVVSYCEQAGMPCAFSAAVPGHIAKAAQGSGWGYDPIFVPRGCSGTFAEIPDKNKFSHRRMALTKFVNWLGTRESSDQQTSSDSAVR